MESAGRKKMGPDRKWINRAGSESEFGKIKFDMLIGYAVEKMEVYLRGISKGKGKGKAACRIVEKKQFQKGELKKKQVRRHWIVEKLRGQVGKPGKRKKAGLVATRAEQTVWPPRNVCSTCRYEPRLTKNYHGWRRCVFKLLFRNCCCSRRCQRLVGGEKKEKTKVSLLPLIRRTIKIFH